LEDLGVDGSIMLEPNLRWQINALPLEFLEMIFKISYVQRPLPSLPQNIFAKLHSQSSAQCNSL